MEDVETTLAEAVLGLIGTRWRLNNLTFIDEEAGFIYFSAPAAANFRTNGSLQKGVAHMRGQALSIPNLQMVGNREKGLLGNPKSVGFHVFADMLEDEAVLKLAFVRDPVERFAAIYRHQFSINAKGAVSRSKLFEFLGMPETESLSMLDLAELLTEEAELKDLLVPLISQRRLIAFDLVDYDFIGRHERWDEDYVAIALELFGCETPRFDPVKDLSADPEGAKLAANVDDETRAALEVAYAEDYEMIEEIEELFPNGFAAQA